MTIQLPPVLANNVVKILAHSVRHQELGVFRPTVEALRQFHFFFAKRFTMRFLRVLAVRRTVANVTFDNNQLGPIVDAKRMVISIG